MIVAFGEYLPDIPANGNPGLTVAANCIPYATHYEPFNDLVAYTTTAMASTCRGFIYARDSVGNSYSFGGDASALYKLSGTGWDDASTSSFTYATTTTDNWEFVQWGDSVIGTNYNDPIQEISLSAANFASLAGTPPNARHIAVVRDFIVLGNCNDFSTGAARPNRVHWSAFDDKTDWTPAAATQCDFQDLYGESGWIQKVVGGEFGVVFQERAITRMTYVGSPLVFQFDNVIQNQGTPCPNSVVKHGTNIFFLGQDDFYIFNGNSLTPIGTNRVYNTFINDYDPTYYYRVSAAVDPVHSIVAFAYPSTSASAGNPDKLLLYNIASNKWAGPINLNIEILCNYQTQGVTLDGLDALYATLESVSDSLDSRVWMGGALTFAAFNTSHNIATFTGSALTASFVTGEKQLLGGRKALVTNTRPLIDGTASVSVVITSRNIQGATTTSTLPSVVNAEGEAPVMSEARYHRFEVDVADGFDKAYGIEVNATVGGEY